MDNQKLLQ